MAEEKLLNIRDVSLLLGISEREVIELAESGAIPAYKIAGVYLRFKRLQVEEYKKRLTPLAHKVVHVETYSVKEKLNDFFYYNDFYILSGLLVLIIIVIILRG